MGRVRRLRHVAAVATGLLVLGAASAAAEPFTTKALEVTTLVGPGGDVPCAVAADLYTPASASAATPRPALLATNGFGGSKSDLAGFARAYAAEGYVVLAYSGLGFGGSGCKITLDDRDFDGKAGRELVTLLGGGRAADDGTRIDYVTRDSVGSDGRPTTNDPRVGMFGGSYGGQNQFAVAGIDPRVDTIVPSITWNDLSYSLAPNNTSLATGVTYRTPGVEKFDWVSLLFGVGLVSGASGLENDPKRIVGCPNFDDRACAAKAQLDVEGAPNAATLALARNASVASYLDAIRIPTLLAQGQADTLFNLQESVATFRGLRARGVPVKMIWQSHGHSDSSPEPGELRIADTQNYQGRSFRAWFDHYLKGAAAKPSLDISYFRDWVGYDKAGDRPDATPAFARSATYPLAPSRRLLLSGSDALVSEGSQVAPGTSSFATTPGGATSYSETSAADQSGPVTDAPGTFARYATPPLAEDTDVVGVPRARLRISAPASAAAGGASDGQKLALFIKLYDIAPDGAITLKRRLISPIRVADQSAPVEVELPGIVHRFAKGHRIALTIASGDTAYRTNNVAGPVTIATDPQNPGVLELPVASPAAQAPVVEAGVTPRRGAPAAGTTKAACRSRRAFRVRIRQRDRRQVRSGSVLVAGKRVARLRRGRTSALINLRGIPKSTVQVHLVTTLAGGRRVTDVRRYRLCAPRR